MFVVTPADDFVGPDEEESGENVGVLLEARLVGELAVDLELLLAALFHLKYISTRTRIFKDHQQPTPIPNQQILFIKVNFS
jgi:hypothetical protein